MEKEEKLVCYLEAIIAEKKIKGQRITKTELAKQLGMTNQAISAMTKSKTAPSIKKGLRLARILGVTIHDLWKLEDINTHED